MRPALLRTISIGLAGPALLALAACSDGADSGEGATQAEASTQTLADARKGQDAMLTEEVRQDQPAPTPPANVLTMVSYPAAAGETSGYLTPAPTDGKRHPAIIWISGGDQSLGDFWSPQPADNDQSAAIFREKGLVVFYPSMRGLNGNPGKIEGFYGELDDIVAATKWLKQQPYVDPDRVYLGGHSSGGTLVLLASEYAADWAGVFSFGPVADMSIYHGSVPLPFDRNNEQAMRLRSPIHWLASIKRPTFIIEGNLKDQSNLPELQLLQAENRNENVHFVQGGGCDHFNVLRAGSEIIADAILANNVASLAQDKRFATLCGS